VNLLVPMHVDLSSVANISRRKIESTYVEVLCLQLEVKSCMNRPKSLMPLSHHNLSSSEKANRTEKKTN